MPLAPVTAPTLLALAKRFADMEFGDFVSDAEWYQFLTFGVRDFYDKIVESHNHEAFLRTHSFQVTSPVAVYSLPDDVDSIKGVDFALQAFPSRTSGTTSYAVFLDETDAVPLYPYTFDERHEGSNDNALWVRRLGGVPMRWRTFIDIQDDEGSEVVVNRIRFSGLRNGYVNVWYLPTPPIISASSTTQLYSLGGYEEYPALYAAKLALTIEESDTRVVDALLKQVEDRLKKASARTEHPGRIQDKLDVYPNT